MKKFERLRCSILVLVVSYFQAGIVSRSSEAQDVPDDATSAAFEGFETSRRGTFSKLSSQVGLWNVLSGNAVINRAQATIETQCLQLPGGKENIVVLQLSPDVPKAGVLKFQAERWTSRAPFSFQIQAYARGAWREIYDGTDTVRVGRAFLSEISVELPDDETTKLRFSVVSPPDTGVLIDNFRIEPRRPQKIVSVASVPLTLPALIGGPPTPISKTTVVTSGNLNAIQLTHVNCQIKGGDQMASLFITVEDGMTQLQLPLSSAATTRAFPLPQPITLKEGDNAISIGCTLREDANIDERVGAKIVGVEFSNGKRRVMESTTSLQRLGVALRNAGDDGNHTYRIPGLATTNRKTLIAVYDVRHRSGRDLPGDIDVGMSRSTDGGRTWDPMQIIMDMGDNPDWRYDGVGDPAVLVDQNTGTVWVAATWSHGNRSWVGSGPGLKPEETGQLMLVRSDDDGQTWSKPINITSQVKKPEWSFVLQGPGKGITMNNGTIVFAAQYQDPPNTSDKFAHRLPHSTIIFSKDHGNTWQTGTGAFDDTTEAQLVEAEPGVLMLNCRYNRSSSRVVMTTKDMGQTWHEHSTSRQALIEPRACMASLIDVDRETGKQSAGWLLFSNPNSTSGRNHITIKASPDRGLTWPARNQILLDEGNGAGYSCLSMIDEQTIGILYEGSRAQMTFQRVALSDLIGN